MTIKTLRSPFVASGPLVPLVLVMFTTVLQHTTTEATSSSSTILSSCEAESNACLADAECYGCITDFYLGVDAAEEDEFAECVENHGYDEADACSWWPPTPCCQDVFSRNDCLGSSLFVEFNVCLSSAISTEAGFGECTALTCSGGGSAVEPVDDVDEDGGDAGVAEDDAGVADDVAGDEANVVGDDAGVAGDDAGVAGDDAGEVDDDAGAIDGDAGATDDDGGAADGDRDIVGDDAGVADDDAGGTDNDNMGVVGDDADAVGDDGGGEANDEAETPLGVTTSSASTCFGQLGKPAGVLSTSAGVFVGVGVLAVGYRYPF